MVLITASTTSPVNPPGATPVLTHDDLWAALVAKARHPAEFVAVIEKSRIIHEDAQGLTRGVTFKGDMGNGGEMEEVIKYVGKMKVCRLYPSHSAVMARTKISRSTSSSPKPAKLYPISYPLPRPKAKTCTSRSHSNGLIPSYSLVAQRPRISRRSGPR